MKEKIHEELNKLQNELARLKEAVEHIDSAKKASKSAVDSAEEVIATSQKLSKEYYTLADKAGKLVAKIDSVDFPIRFDKLDANVAGIVASVQSTQSRLDTVEANISSKIEGSIKEMFSKIDSSEGKIIEKVRGVEDIVNKFIVYQEKKNNTFLSLIIVTLVSILINFVALAFILKVYY